MAATAAAIDAVYVLGHGSRWQDHELRYSLRSLATYVTGLRFVWLIGQRPAWVTRVVHVPWPDPHRCKERNIAEKVLAACRQPDLTSRFLFLNDDHFALGECHAPDLPSWYAGTVQGLAHRMGDSNHYKQSLLNTQQALEQLGHATYNFDVHTPIVFDKELFPLAMACYNWETPRGFVVKSLYANSVGVPGTVLGDTKISGHLSIPELTARLRGRPWWSCGPTGLNLNLKALLAHLYPDPSPFEL